MVPTPLQFINTNTLIGYRVFASDGPVGRVDEATLETPLTTIVVSTGHVFHRMHAVRSGQITAVDHHERTVTLAVSRRQLRTSPEYHAQESFDTAVVDEQELLAA